MKVLMVNGSPHPKGCTYTALEQIAETLKNEGIESEIYTIGIDPIAPCRACGACAKLKRCVINDKVNEFLDLAEHFDAYIIGSPVHYASASGAVTTFMDRVFFVNYLSGRNIFRSKPGAAVASARRSGTTATLDQLNKYFQINEMPIISGRYWNMIHGHTPQEALQDREGLQNLRILAKNMAYYLKCKEAAAGLGIYPPEKEEPVYTNFIR